MKLWRKKSFVIQQGRQMELKIQRMATVFKWDVEESYNGDCISVWYLIDNTADEVNDTRKIKVHCSRMNDKIAADVLLDNYLCSNEHFIVMTCK